MKNQYCYSITHSGQKLFGGTVTADTMEEAVRRLIRQHNITTAQTAAGIRPVDGAPWRTIELQQNGQQVNVNITANPQQFLTKEEKR